MAKLRVKAVEGEAERVSPADINLQRQVKNLELANYIGQFIAGQVVGQFEQQDLSSRLKDEVALSVVWG